MLTEHQARAFFIRRDSRQQGIVGHDGIGDIVVGKRCVALDTRLVGDHHAIAQPIAPECRLATDDQNTRIFGIGRVERHHLPAKTRNGGLNRDHGRGSVLTPTTSITSG
ncbi:hypothetical protein SDC9_211319 [bioreactor metagenome]|uniref:Uncharacterized protein n=1 Tax=bioreactor metagenome TaxID=1076179 RepID=A0A645JIQ2_9ZZZZ